MQFRCPKCDKLHKVKDELGGKKAKCKCGHSLTIPMPPKKSESLLCPKCRSPIKKGDISCLSCGIVFEKYNKIKNDQAGVAHSPKSRPVQETSKTFTPDTHPTEDLEPEDFDDYPWPTNILIAKPWLAGALGGIIALVCAIFLPGFIKEYKSYPDVPPIVLLEEARELFQGKEEILVSLKEMEWLCQLEFRDIGGDIRVDIPLKDPKTGGLVVVNFNDTVDCEVLSHAPVTGVLEVLKQGKFRTNLTQKGLIPPFYDMPVYYLCTWCGPENAWYGIIVCSAFLIIGLMLYPVCNAAKLELLKKKQTPFDEKSEFGIGTQGVISMLVGIGLTGFTWYMAITKEYFYEVTALLGPAIIIGSIGMFIWPDAFQQATKFKTYNWQIIFIVILGTIAGFLHIMFLGD
ncbi:MAG: hypothetical protein GY729_11140 [Desulfobacteraceae bacterium]|nr:hypothetical protein [Desulfobacteraceae bacterium]